MSNVLSLVFVAASVLLLALGFSASESFSSDVSRAFTGEPTNRAMWMIAGAVLCAALGVGTFVMGRRPHRSK